MSYVYPTIPSEATHVTVSARAGDENAMDVLQSFSATLTRENDELVFEALVDAAIRFLDQVLLDTPHYDEYGITAMFRMSDQAASIDYPVTP